jgi:hypothetical protein
MSTLSGPDRIGTMSSIRAPPVYRKAMLYLQRGKDRLTPPFVSFIDMISAISELEKGCHMIHKLSEGHIRKEIAAL